MVNHDEPPPATEETEPEADAAGATADDALAKLSGASIEETLPNGEKVTIADFDSSRLAKNDPAAQSPS